MDTVTMIVTALVLGASAGLKAVADTAVRDGYAAIKKRLAERFPAVDISPLERMPESPSKCQSVAEDLTVTAAADDPELLALAEALIRAVEEKAPDVAESVGVRLEDLKARNITLDDIVSSGSGVVGRNWQAEGDIAVAGVRAGQGGPEPGK